MSQTKRRKDTLKMSNKHTSKLCGILIKGDIHLMQTQKILCFYIPLKGFKLELSDFIPFLCPLNRKMNLRTQGNIDFNMENDHL